MNVRYGAGIGGSLGGDEMVSLELVRILSAEREREMAAWKRGRAAESRVRRGRVNRREAGR